MLSTIDELFFKECHSPDSEFGDGYEMVVREAKKKEKELMEILKDNVEAVNIFKEYLFAEREKAFEEMRSSYKSGFRSGFRIAIDALDEDDLIPMRLRRVATKNLWTLK